jgi:hypothetical protein
VAKLTTETRNKLPDSAFAGAGRSYPIENASHARNALARVSQQENAGNISESTADEIRAKARKKLRFFRPKSK